MRHANHIGTRTTKCPMETRHVKRRHPGVKTTTAKCQQIATGNATKAGQIAQLSPYALRGYTPIVHSTNNKVTAVGATARRQGLDGCWTVIEAMCA